MNENNITLCMEVIFFGLLILLCVGVLLIRIASAKYWHKRCPNCKVRAGTYLCEDNTIRCNNCCVDLTPNLYGE